MEKDHDRIFDVREVSIEEICANDYEFVIPVYQRPYVWDEIQINKLLEDLKTNFQLKKEYYVGNVYVTRREDLKTSFDVIDGQQRFTTFWLISLYFKDKASCDLKNFIKNKGYIARLHFEIRHEVSSYFEKLINNNLPPNENNIENEIFLKYIDNGIKTIDAFFKMESNAGIAYDIQKYIYESVRFIFNIAPKNTDLNSLFATLGNSGLQLEQSDILKARLLHKLSDEHFEYSKIWEACENLNNYFERNLMDVFEVDKTKLDVDSFAFYNLSLFNLQGSSTEDKITSGKPISQIVLGDFHQADKKLKESEGRCRSIINFNCLLLHTYRIYRIRHSNEIDIPSFDPKKLLEIFNGFVKLSKEDDVKIFLELLWQVRFFFDKYVIKWRLPNSESSDIYEEHLLLTTLSKQDGIFLRTNRSFSNIQMLQSVLYFNSGFAQQYWLTPYLNYLLDHAQVQDNDLLKILEGVDNFMLPGNKKESSWNLSLNIQLKSEYDFSNYFTNDLGTGFEHYWFYKIEYLLWKSWKDRDKNEFRKYRITSKNSVEHVFPQNDEYGRELESHDIEKSSLHSLGNLALLSVGQNSSYNNQSVGKKKIDFFNKPYYDSLKLYKIFSSFIEESEWDDFKIEEHKNQMVALLLEHYKN